MLLILCINRCFEFAVVQNRIIIQSRTGRVSDSSSPEMNVSNALSGYADPDNESRWAGKLTRSVSQLAVAFACSLFAL